MFRYIKLVGAWWDVTAYVTVCGFSVSSPVSFHLPNMLVCGLATLIHP